MIAQGLVKRCSHEVGWDWASNEKLKLESEIASLEGSMTAFDHQMKTRDIRDVRKAYKDQEQILKAELDSYVLRLKEPVEKINEMSKMVLAMHAARQTVSQPPKRQGRTRHKQFRFCARSCDASFLSGQRGSLRNCRRDSCVPRGRAR